MDTNNRPSNRSGNTSARRSSSSAQRSTAQRSSSGTQRSTAQRSGTSQRSSSGNQYNSARRRKKKRSVSPLLIVLIIALVLVIGVFAGLGVYVMRYNNYDKILPNVYVAGINVGGMTRSEAYAAIESALPETVQQSVNVNLPDQVLTFTPEQDTVLIDVDRAAEEAYECRKLASSLFGVGDPERVVFCMNATHALNIALRSCVGPGDRVSICMPNTPQAIILFYAINRIGDITIASLPDHYPVTKGMKLAGERIIPLVCRESEIEQAEALVRESDRPLMELVPYRKNVPTGIIVTGSEVYSGRIADKFEPVVREKMSAYEANVIGCIFCDDYIEMLDSAIAKWRERGAKLIIMTGGMSVDPDDLTVSAIRGSGAEIITQGVPAQPGNMFCVAYLDDITILGVPGAAIHAKTTMQQELQFTEGEKVVCRRLIQLICHKGKNLVQP